MSVSTSNHRMPGSTAPFRFYKNTDSYGMLRRRAKDEAWLYGWFWWPIRRAWHRVTMIDTVEFTIFAILILLVLLAMFCLFMAFLAAFNMPLHHEVVTAIEIRISR